MSEVEKEYGAILVDTSIFYSNGLRLEKGLLKKLAQFKKSPIELLLPDVVKNEVKSHLESEIKKSRMALKKALDNAGDYLFFEGSELNDAKQILIDSKEIEGLAESRVDKFMDTTGALVLETGDYVSVSDLLSKYFANEPPFAEAGKKKYEFPDAIVLMAVEAWAGNHDLSVLAIAKDGDWEQYCEKSERIDYQEDLSSGLSYFNTANAPYALLTNLETALNSGTANTFISSINSRLKSVFNGFTPEQDADTHLYWEPEGSDGWLHDFELSDSEFRIIDKDEDWVVLGALANITVEAEGEFSLYEFDRDHAYIGGISATATKEFESEILITISGNLNGPLDDLSVDEVEVVNPISSIHFGTLEPNYSEYD
jgi:hypothetical protein